MDKFDEKARELDSKIHTYYGLGMTVPEDIVYKRHKLLSQALRDIDRSAREEERERIARKLESEGQLGYATEV